MGSGSNLLVSDNVLDDGTEKKTKVSDYEKYMKDNVAGQMNFDEKYDIKADFEFWLRCLKNKKRFDKLNITMGNYYFNFSGVSMTNNEERDRQHKDIVEKHYKDEPVSIFDFYNKVAGAVHPLAAAQSVKTFSKMIINRE